MVGLDVDLRHGVGHQGHYLIRLRGYIIPTSKARKHFPEPDIQLSEAADSSSNPLKSRIPNLSSSRRRWKISIIMQAANRLQKALKAGSGLSFGAWQMLPGSNHARTVARCGYDWICVDCEHGNIDGNLDPLAGFKQMAPARVDF